jgi:hypothetical protein
LVFARKREQLFLNQTESETQSCIFVEKSRDILRVLTDSVADDEK